MTLLQGRWNVTYLGPLSIRSNLGGLSLSEAAELVGQNIVVQHYTDVSDVRLLDGWVLFKDRAGHEHVTSCRVDLVEVKESRDERNDRAGDL